MAALLGQIGLELTLSCISGFTSAASSIFYITDVVSTYKGENAKIITTILDLDIANSVKVLEQLLNELEITEESSNTLHICIKSLHDVIKQIEHEFSEIQNKLEYNRSLYVFKNLRSCKFNNTIKRLTTLKSILDNRRDLLFRTISMDSVVLKKKEVQESEVDKLVL